MRGLIGALVSTALLLPGVALAGEFQSQFTDVDFDQCTLITSDEMGGTYACPGYRGIPVMIGEGDHRTFVSYGLTSTTEKAAQQTLPPFNHFAKNAKIEWRLEQGDEDWVPVATILRWFTSRETGEKEGQVLVVTQLLPGATCHIAYIDALAVKDANAMAQKIADEKAGSFDCANEPEVVQPFKAY
ncbi:MAG: hypothetical protein Q7T08_04215 [Devosia sp.]|nr:hypothetical protein [Devosia sp.]